jgi:hypothetical protein
MKSCFFIYFVLYSFCAFSQYKENTKIGVNGMYFWSACGTETPYKKSELVQNAGTQNGSKGIKISEKSELPNCLLIYKPINDNIKLSNVLAEGFVLKLEYSTLISYTSMIGYKFNAELQIKKALGIGKTKIIKGQWSLTTDSKLIIYLDDGRKKYFSVNKLVSGYIQELRDLETERIYTISQVEKL